MAFIRNKPKTLWFYLEFYVFTASKTDGKHAIIWCYLAISSTTLDEMFAAFLAIPFRTLNTLSFSLSFHFALRFGHWKWSSPNQFATPMAKLAQEKAPGYLFEDKRDNDNDLHRLCCMIYKPSHWYACSVNKFALVNRCDGCQKCKTIPLTHD